MEVEELVLLILLYPIFKTSPKYFGGMNIVLPPKSIAVSLVP